MLTTASTQYSYRITCPFCLDPGGHLRVAYQVRDGMSQARPIVVTFSCVHGNRPGHGTPSDAELLHVLTSRLDCARLADYVTV
jgi:hypothetical protein